MVGASSTCKFHVLLTKLLDILASESSQSTDALKTDKAVKSRAIPRQRPPKDAPPGRQSAAMAGEVPAQAPHLHGCGAAHGQGC